MDCGPLPRPRRRQRNPAGLGARPGRDFDLDGLPNFGPAEFDKAQTIDFDEWRRELLSQDELFMKLYSQLPKEMVFQRELLKARL